MSIVVSDTSPIRGLEFIGHLSLLEKLFNEVIVPPAVRDELLTPRKRFRPVIVELIPHAVVQAPRDSALVDELMQQLQRGEAEAIALAQEIKATLLIDEMAGRRFATTRGMKVVGLVGLLVTGKKKGLIDQLTPLLERLRSDLGFYLSDSLIKDAQREAGE